MRKIAVWDRLRIEHLWVFAVLVGVFVFINTHPIQPYDFWFHIATGRETLQTGSIPQLDTFSFTAHGYPYPSNNIYWLAQIVFYKIYEAGGAAWMVLFTSLVITLAYGILLYLGYRHTRNWRVAAAGALFAAVLSIDNWNVRPQILAYLYAALCLWIIASSMQKPDRARLVLYPFVMILWVNCHGTFFIGLILLLFLGVNEAWKAYLQSKISRKYDIKPLIIPVVVGAASGLACLINPKGIGIIQTITNVSRNHIVQEMIVEWQPPNFTAYSGILYLLLLSFAGILIFLNRRQVKLFQVLCFFFFGIMGLMYVRAMIWFGMILAPVVAEGIAARINQSKWLEESPARSWRLNLMNMVVLSLLIILAVFSLPWFKHCWPVTPEKRGLLAYNTPIEATNFLIDENLPAPVFHDMAFGSYLTWAAVPRYLVFVDPRIELYPLDTWVDYLKINAAVPDWQARLDSYGIQTLMLYRKDQAVLIHEVEKSWNWVQRYQDETAVIFTRR